MKLQPMCVLLYQSGLVHQLTLQKKIAKKSQNRESQALYASVTPICVIHLH